MLVFYLFHTTTNYVLQTPFFMIIYLQVLYVMVAAVTIPNCLGGVVSAAYSIPYASSYNAHVINHALAAPVAPPLAPIVAARVVAPPIWGAPLPYSTLLG